MNEFKGTPGPWMVDEYGDVKECNGEFFIAGCRGIIDVEKDEHNANLIAAAPELLEALQCCEDFLSGMHSLGFGGLALVEHTRTTISKALGIKE